MDGPDKPGHDEFLLEIQWEEDEAASASGRGGSSRSAEGRPSNMRRNMPGAASDSGFTDTLGRANGPLTD
jgi:hypothetical protein